jgi:hypothetical protein
MKVRSWDYWTLLAIGALTVLAGLLQAAAPEVVLRLVSGDVSPANRHSFAIVGMFMVLFGGLLSHALLSPGHLPVAVLWSGLQKLGAAGAVGLGVGKGVFGSLGLLVAGFDLVSGLLALRYWSSIRAPR